MRDGAGREGGDGAEGRKPARETPPTFLLIAGFTDILHVRGGASRLYRLLFNLLVHSRRVGYPSIIPFSISIFLTFVFHPPLLVDGSFASKHGVQREHIFRGEGVLHDYARECPCIR